MISGDALRTEHWMDNDLHGGYEDMPSILSLGNQFFSEPPFSLSATMGVFVLWDPSSVVPT